MFVLAIRRAKSRSYSCG